MERADKNLAFMLQYENVAWYENGIVNILDRRIYPKEIKYVTCRNHIEVAQAITDMVTQSAGPYTAVGMGMALAAKENPSIPYLEKASYTLSHARPTTAKRMEMITKSCLEVAVKAIAEGKRDIDIIIRSHVVELNNRRYEKLHKAATYLVEKIPNNGTVMTQCFAETIIGMMLRECREKNKNIRLFCPETRPYFQGARLTATVCQQMGFDTTVITDNMPLFVMKNEHVDVFTCAADCITIDGYVVNKVGTGQIALCAKECNIPMYVSGTPDINHPTIDTVKIEMRNPQDTIHALGTKTTIDGVKGYYPAFDITEPKFVTGIVTDLGIYKPNELKKYLDITDNNEVTV